MAHKPRISIVGAGLAGLTTAIALRKFGLEPSVYEQASVLGEIGAGVQLSPNAMHVFAALGLDRAVAEVSFEPEQHCVRAWNDGHIVSAMPVKSRFRTQFGAGFYQMHRADLHAALCAQVPVDSLRLNHACTGVDATGDAPILHFTEREPVESDVVIAADGIHSVIRSSLFGAESPRFTGNVCWRGLVPALAVTPGAISPDTTAWFGPGAHVVTYYVRGGTLINYIANRVTDDWRGESWALEGSREELLDAFPGWHPTVLELLSKTERCYKWALYDRDPLDHWVRGGVALIGDAAHPMLPFLAQGACMAVEDGYAVAALLAAMPDVHLALESYEAIRRPRASRVQLAARGRAKTNQLASPLARAWRNLAYTVRRLLKPSAHTYGIDWIYEYDVVTAVRALIEQTLARRERSPSGR